MTVARALITPLLGALWAASASSSTAVTIGESYKLYSSVLGEERTVLVALPRAYKTESQRYPVLFVLDGEAHFQHAAATARFLSDEGGSAPDLIVVGIPNNARLRDLSPPTDVPED